jgi:putative FmdB family regulatory protein
MPTYEYKCEKCEKIVEIVHSIKESPKFMCEDCPDQILIRLISNNFGGFIIKGEAPSKVIKEQGYRRKHNADLGVRQVERYGSGPVAVPNVAGVETESWTDAAKLAKECGLNSDTYKPMIEKEKTVSKTSNVDDKVWKQAKETKGVVNNIS